MQTLFDRIPEGEFLVDKLCSIFGLRHVLRSVEVKPTDTTLKDSAILRSRMDKKKLDATELDLGVRVGDFDASIGDLASLPVELMRSQQAQRDTMPTDSRDQFRPTCTVVICTHNRPTELNRCLEAVTQLYYPHFDVLVVDNAPNDDQARQLAMHWGVRYIVEPAVGLSRARNRGARACSTEILAFLDDDSFPEPTWLTALAKPFGDPLVMAVTGRIVASSFEKQPQHTYAWMSTFNANGHQEAVIDREAPYWFERANFGGIGDGGNMAFRRCAFDVWPGFDERLGRGTLIDGGEEHHAFFSLLDLGYRVAHTSHAVVRHPLPQTIEDFRLRYVKGLASAAAYFMLLLVEQPHHRAIVIKYILSALRSKPREWRGEGLRPRPRIVPTWRMLLALMRGPLLYTRSQPKIAVWTKQSASRVARPKTPLKSSATLASAKQIITPTVVSREQQT
jgi:O-antigen biosynthesis protein